MTMTGRSLCGSEKVELGYQVQRSSEVVWDNYVTGPAYQNLNYLLLPDFIQTVLVFVHVQTAGLNPILGRSRFIFRHFKISNGSSLKSIYRHEAFVDIVVHY